MKFQNISISIGYLLLVFLNSCTNSKVSQEQDSKHIRQTYVYECDGGYNFTASIENDAVWLFLPDQTLKLPRVLSSSGAKYSENDRVFWSKGNKALLEIAHEKYQSCIYNRARAIWEDAKLNGWDYRAFGNEPGWHLLVSKEKGILFVSDYGQTVNNFSSPEPLVDRTKAITKYHVQEDGHDLQITLKGVKCLDTMSDESFETTATVILDGKKFNGCGKALH